MPDLSELMLRLGTKAAADLEALWDHVLAGRLLPGDFIDAAVARMTLYNGQGQVLAAADFAQQLTQAIGELPADYRAAAPLAHATDAGRLGSGLSTMTERAVTAEAAREVTTQLVRYAKSEVFEATQRQYAEELKRPELVEGWTRGLENGACQLCNWWWREGRVWPATHTMAVHKGCHCRQIPVWRRGIRRVSRSAMNQSGERRMAGTLEERRAMDVSDYSSRSLRRGSND